MPTSPVSSREVHSTPVSASAPYFPINSPLHSLSSTPSEATTDRQVDQLWNDLERETCRTFVVNTNVDTAYAEVPCVGNANLITVKTNCADALPEPIHAHYIQQQHTDPVDRTKTTQHCYAAGQSPAENCTNFLIQGLDSGQGIYQFVSRKAHLEGVGKGGKTIIQMLREKTAASSQPWLNDRFQILNFKPVKGHSENEDYVQYELEALDSITRQKKKVLVTQAGLKFTDHILQPDQIAHANELFQEHLDWLQTNASANLSTAHGPLVVSQAGIGRNAVLITYRDMCTRIDSGSVDKNTLDTILKDVILAGRNSRGPKFLHSKLQLKALREALLTKLAQHQKPSPSFMQRARELFLNNLPSFGQDAQQSHVKSPTPRAASQSSLSSSSPSSNSSDRRSTIAPFFPEVEPAIPAQVPRPTNNVPAKPQTTLDDFADMQVGGIVVSASSQDPTQPPIYPTEISWQPWSRKVDGHHFVPEKLQSYYEAVLAEAERKKLTSICFGADLLAFEQDGGGPSPEAKKKLSARAAAIAVVTATRHLANPDAKLKSILFQCKTDQQKSLYDSLIANEGQLSQHRTYQALLRDPIYSPTEATDPQDFFDRSKLAVFTPQVVSINAHNRPQPLSPPPAVEGTLNGIAFTSAKTNQQTSPSWSTHLGNFDEGATDHLTAAGVVIVEGSGDGRVWVVAPTNRFMRLENTFPKGQIDRDMTGPMRARITAVKEAWEESGLEVELVGVLCDAGMGDSTRYYLAKRIGGTPGDVGWESQAVKLIPRDQLLDVFPDNRDHGRDRYVATQLSSHFDRNARSVALNSAANIDIRRTRQQWRPRVRASSAPLPQPGSPVEAGIHQMQQQIHNFTAFDVNENPDNNFNTAASHLSETLKHYIWQLVRAPTREGGTIQHC